MIPTRGQVKARFQSMLDDPAGEVFDEAVFADAFNEAFDVLYHAFLQYQVPRIELVAYFTVNAGTESLTPAAMNIPDMGDFIYVAERRPTDTGRYSNLQAVDRLNPRAPSDRLHVFNYRNDTFYFPALSAPVSLEIKYESSGTAPVADNVVINVDGSLTFLSNYAVGIAGPRKGYDEIAQRSMVRAVGPRFDNGDIGGELFRLVQTRVRSRQKEGPLAPRPFSAGRRFGVRRALPYVEAQPGTTGSNYGDSPSGNTPDPQQQGYGVGPLGGNPLGS